MTPTPSAREPQAIARAMHIIGVWKAEYPHLVQPESWLADMIALRDAYDALAAEREEWKRRYFLVADAVAERSDDAEQLADIARATRYERDACRRELIDANFLNEALRERLLAAERERDALRADAERWRYVRDHGYVVTMGVTLPSGEQVGGGRVGDVYATGCVDAMMALDRDMLDGEARG